jgi:hypothetical protein
LIKFAIGEDVVAVDVLVSEFADGDGHSAFPFIYWGFASFFLVPVAVDKVCSAAVRLFSYLNFLLVNAVIFAFRVLGVVYSSDSVGIPASYESIHSFFLEAVD